GRRRAGGGGLVPGDGLRETVAKGSLRLIGEQLAGERDVRTTATDRIVLGGARLDPRLDARRRDDPRGEVADADLFSVVADVQRPALRELFAHRGNCGVDRVRDEAERPLLVG